jgi:hypothetical protein
MRNPFPLSKREIANYDATLQLMRKQLGSYDAIATWYHGATGIRITGQTVRVWFKTRSIPVPQAAVLVRLTSGARLADLFPWLPDFLGDSQ